MLNKLLPKEQRFFAMFHDAAAKIHEGAMLCQAMVTQFDRLEERARQIKEAEHACDQITHQTLALLNSTFVTPFDREDIHLLITRMDNILDAVDAGCQRLYLYKIQKPTEDLKQQIGILCRATGHLTQAMSELKNLRKSKNLMHHCVEINTCENEGDAVMRTAMARLFDEEKDAITIIKWKSLYETFEDAIDASEDVANIIESIVLKNT